MENRNHLQRGPLQSADGRYCNAAALSKNDNDGRSVNVLVYVGYYYTKNSVKISCTGAFTRQKHKHAEGLKPVAANQVPDTLEIEISVM